jgi:hypothetical protein
MFREIALFVQRRVAALASCEYSGKGDAALQKQQKVEHDLRIMGNKHNPVTACTDKVDAHFRSDA